MNLDFSRDFALVYDNLEAVTYLSATRGSGDVDYVPAAKRRPLRKAELAASGGAYTSLDRVWLIPSTSFLPDFQPKPADVVTDAGGATWTVLDVEAGKESYGGPTWKLTTRNPIIAYQLQDLVDVQQSGLSLDAAGVAVRAWPPAGGTVLAAAAPCRVQPLSQEVKDERGLRGGETHYSIHLARQLNIVNVREVRVLWQGVVLDATEYKDGNRIDILPEITALAKA